jgi:hypothetical protein
MRLFLRGNLLTVDFAIDIVMKKEDKTAAIILNAIIRVKDTDV